MSALGGFAEVQAGYVVALAGLAAYGGSLLLRERAARRRLPDATPLSPPGQAATDTPAEAGPSTPR